MNNPVLGMVNQLPFPGRDIFTAGKICISSLNSVPAVVRVAPSIYSGEEEIWRAGKG